MAIGEYGSGEYGSSPYGGAFPPYGLESVTALTPTLIRVRYTALFDASFAPLLLTSNYSIFPALTINTVIVESAQTVLLITENQADVVYTLTLNEARGYFGQPLDPSLDQRTFQGLAVAPGFYAIATRNTRVRAVFSEPMMQNAALTNPGDYQVSDFSGNLIPITAVETEQATSPRSVVLTLGSALTDERHYKVTVSSGIITATNKPISPDTASFQ